MMYAFVLRTWFSDLVGVTCLYICGKDKVNNSGLWESCFIYN